MISEKSGANIQVFIDGQNLYMGTTRAKRAPWKVDFAKFRRLLEEEYGVTRARYFMGTFKPEEQKLYDNLRRWGFEVVFRKCPAGALSAKKGNVDTDIVLAMMKESGRDEEFKAILVSGDGDYAETVDYLMQKGQFLKLLVPSRAAMSSLYKRLPEEYLVQLDDAAMKLKIIYREDARQAGALGVLFRPMLPCSRM